MVYEIGINVNQRMDYVDELITDDMIKWNISKWQLLYLINVNIYHFKIQTIGETENTFNRFYQVYI